MTVYAHAYKLQIKLQSIDRSLHIQEIKQANLSYLELILYKCNCVGLEVLFADMMFIKCERIIQLQLFIFTNKNFTFLQMILQKQNQRVLSCEVKRLLIPSIRSMMQEYSVSWSTYISGIKVYLSKLVVFLLLIEILGHLREDLVVYFQDIHLTMERGKLLFLKFHLSTMPPCSKL